MKTKITNIMLATLVMTMTMVPTAANANTTSKTGTFSDLGGVTKEKQDAIRDAVAKGLLAGDSNGQFHPKNVLTRQEFAVLLTRALQLTPVTNGHSSFSDVHSKDWAFSSIEAVRRAGLMSGNERGQFHPQDPITREELAVVLVRAIHGVGAHGTQHVSLKDASAVSGWASDAVDTAVRLHLIDTLDGKLNPKGTMKREDIAPFLLEAFQTQERSAVISNVDGDFITVNGKQYLIDSQLKELLGDRNQDALQGAVLKYKSTNLTLGEIGDLEIVKSGAVLDLGSTRVPGSLKISADGVTVKGQNCGELVVDKGVSRLNVEVPVQNLVVDTDQSLQLTGNGTIGVLQVKNADAKVTLDKGIQIDKVQLPDQAKVSEVFPNLDPSNPQIKDVSGGVDDRQPQLPVIPTPSPSPKPKNHAPKVAHTIASVTCDVADGDKNVSLADVFSDQDGDALTYSATSSATNVASVAVNGSDVVITPVAVGTATITVTVKDTHGATVKTTFTLTVGSVPVVNHAPTVANALDPITAGVGDGVQTVSLANVFTDADGDDLTYTVESSDTGVATVDVTGTDLVITPVTAGTATITITATDSHGESVNTTVTVTIDPAVPKSLFFSEMVYGSDYMQAFEIYNPTNESIDGSRLRIERSDGGEAIILDGGTIDPGQAFVVMEDQYEGDVNVDYWRSMEFYNDDSPVTLSLYLDDQLIDVAVLTPNQSLARTDGTKIGTTTYDASQWTDEGEDYSDNLGTFAP